MTRASLAFALVALVGCHHKAPETTGTRAAIGQPGGPQVLSPQRYVTTTSGLQYADLAVGQGATPQPGDGVQVHYTLWLRDGTKVDSSYDRGQPLAFTFGAHQVVPGFEEGLVGLRVGGRRQLVIPPELGYGDRDMGIIPPHSTLVFEIELVGVEPAPASSGSSEAPPPP